MPSTYTIAVLADIHGNLQALEAVLSDLEKDQLLDGILVAGDMITGPDEQKVFQKLVDLNAVMIQGNTERGISRMAAGTAPDYFYTAKQFSLARWAFEHLDPEQMAMISHLPEHRVFHLHGADPIHMAHGSPRDVNELVLPDPIYAGLGKIRERIPPHPANQVDEVLQLVAESVLVLGHTHIPWCEQRNGRFAMNPGAVNVPLNGWVGAQYALLCWDGGCWTPEFRAVKYNLEAFIRANHESSYLSAGILARVFMEEAVQGKDISSDFFGMASQMAAEAGADHLPYFPDDIWERVECEFQLPRRE
jgi:predicted phosphodiesterase